MADPRDSPRAPRAIREGNKGPYHSSGGRSLGMSDQGDDLNAERARSRARSPRWGRGDPRSGSRLRATEI
jgi:hypothetical protein